MSNPAQWSDLMIWQTLTDVYGWLLVGWLGFSLAVIAAVDGGGK